MDEAARDRTAGTRWAASAALSVVLMTLHPVGHGGELAERVASLVAIAWRDRFVHGGLIVLMGVGLLGWWRLFERLDLRSSIVRGAALSIVAGTSRRRSHGAACCLARSSSLAARAAKCGCTCTRC
ncbi:MAG: hypothetical protein EXS13_13500 [Planctomycetes bacterium]|nr:hypothetical protein [Planctomycetota bacterium]